MHTKATILILALLGTADLAIAQNVPVTPRTFGSVELGVRASDMDGDAARFQRYQDLRDQGASFEFRLDRDIHDWLLRANARNVGYRDQRFFVGASSPKLTLAFEWNQVPLFYGDVTSTAYVQAAPGVFTLDQSARLAVQNGTAIGIPRTPAQAQTGSLYRTLSDAFDLRARRDRAQVTLAYAATRALSVNVGVDTYKRSGAQPWGAGFAFSALPELPAPLDQRTTDVTAGAEWAHRKGMLRLAYDGSFFSNDVETLTWDNPGRATDYSGNPNTVTGYDPSGYVTGNGAAQGRMALAPSNHTHGVNALGMVKLPGRSAVTANAGVIGMRQDAALIPWTINSVIADPRVYELFPGLASLDRATADADVRVTSANLGFTSKPTRYFGLVARYRYFDRNDRTPTFDATEYVRFDATPMLGGGTTRHMDLTRNTFNVDATITPFRYTSVRLGVGRDVLEHARAYSELGDTTVRAAVHVVGNQYVGLRALYEHTVREASGFDAAVIADAGVQPASRAYDDADRSRDRATLLVDVTPVPFLGLNASVFVGDDEYDDPDQRFGLMNNDNRGYTVGLSLLGGRGLALGASYGYERYSSRQRSRAANPAPDPSWDDASRDWTLDTDESVHTVGMTFDLLRTIRNTEIRLGYDWTDSDQGFLYGGPRIDALASIGQFAPLPAVTNAWQRGTVDVRYFMTPRLGLAGGYWFHKFEVNDFQTVDRVDGTVRTDYVGSLLLGYGYRPFNANTGFLRVFYLF
jgi:MtrB/PioB family decaheme-associated outer membrane protein